MRRCPKVAEWLERGPRSSSPNSSQRPRFATAPIPRTDPRHTDTATTKGLQGALAQCRLADNIILLNEAENI